VIGQDQTQSRNTTADRTIDVLLLFDERQPVLSAAEVSRQLGMPRSTTYRYLQTLRSYGLVEEDEARGGFRLGPRLFHLARVARQGLGLCELALPIMQRLAADSGEMALLARRVGQQVVLVELVESTQPIRLSYVRGDVLPIHAGASPKVLLAYAEPAEIAAVLASAPLPRYTELTITDPDQLIQQLAEIRRQGYAVSHSEIADGVSGIAAPVMHADGRVAAALTVACPSFRLDEPTLHRLVQAVRASAQALSRRLREVHG
jgi:DNA-binding IclR family transcriptional regulator